MPEQSWEQCDDCYGDEQRTGWAEGALSTSLLSFLPSLLAPAGSFDILPSLTPLPLTPVCSSVSINALLELTPKQSELQGSVCSRSVEWVTIRPRFSDTALTRLVARQSVRRLGTGEQSTDPTTSRNSICALRISQSGVAR